MIDFALIQASLPALLKGVVLTLQISSISCLFGTVLGAILGIAQTSGFAILRILVTAYVSVIRGTPMLIQILFGFYLLPQLGISVSPVWTAIIAIGINSSAYICEIVRSGINSVSKGQIEAGKVLGLTSNQITRYIVLPQAIRVVLPALGNELTTLIKDSSLASFIGVYELTKQAHQIIARTYDAISLFSIVALLYFVLISAVSFIMVRVEQRMNRHMKQS